MSGHWKHSDIIEKKFSIDDLLDIIELISIKAINENNYLEWKKAQND